MALKKEYRVFISEMIRHGDENKAVLKAYPHLKGDQKRIRTYCGRLMKNVEVSTAIQQKAKKIAEKAEMEAVSELKEEIKAELLTAIKKREILHKIATGQMLVDKVIFTKMGPETIQVKPDFYERMKAVEIDNKMTGDNAAEKVTLGADEELKNLYKTVMRRK